MPPFKDRVPNRTVAPTTPTSTPIPSAPPPNPQPLSPNAPVFTGPATPKEFPSGPTTDLPHRGPAVQPSPAAPPTKRY